MKTRTIRAIERLIEQEQHAKARDRALRLASKTPLDDDLHRLLDRLVEDHPFRRDPPEISSWSGYHNLKPFTAGKHRSEWWPLLYTLPETFATRSLAPFVPRNRAYKITHEWRGFTIAKRLVDHIPLHPPSMGFYTWYDPRVSMDDDVLTLEQFSVFNGGRKGQGNEDTRLRIYRVRGDLFHARYVRFYLWS